MADANTATYTNAAAAPSTNDNDSVDIVARSIHYNPLNERISAHCPPKDWRSPPVLDGFNDIIRHACRDISQLQQQVQQQRQRKRVVRLRFVNTNFIVAPLWDASTDWGHVYFQASHVEALYLIAISLGLL